MLVAICMGSTEDTQAVRALLRQYAELRPEAGLEDTVFASGDELLDTIGRSYAGFDLYLLDIAPGQSNGIALARRLREQGERRRIVFLTNGPDYAMEAFSVNAAGYLLKPVEWDKLRAVLDRCAEELLLGRNRRRSQYVFRTPAGLHTVAVEDVVSVEIMGHAPYYHLAGGTVRGSELRVSFEAGMAGLRRLGCFLRPHRSFFVNAAHIADLSVSSLRMDDGSTVPVARHHAAELRAAYLTFLAGERPQRTPAL